MNETDFVQKSVTIQKGESVTLVNDSAAIHVIENGSWVDGVQLPKIEAGAPQIQASVDGNISQIIGPFNTAGTFHLYCTVHPNMNLTVIVH
ncbi:cupredoxin domain-containing protein [Dictyobacter formicarum]|nr:plastocyanin/azurin family copper-binding protein [Dictyobacter formicarum]